MEHGLSYREGGFLDGVPGAIEIPLVAGDALVFNDALVHGSNIRTLPGPRRMLVIRYGPNPAEAAQLPPDCLARLGPNALTFVSSEPKVETPPAKL